jgi:hypothetical protein
MPMSSSNMSIDAVKAQIHSIEEARPEGKTGNSSSSSKILNTPCADYHPKKK